MSAPATWIPRRVAVPGVFTSVSAGLAVVTGFAFVQGTGSEQESLVLVGVVGIALLVVGTAWPCVALAGASVAVAAPRDGRAGDPVPVDVEVASRARRVRIRTLDPPGPWFVADPGEPGRLEHPPVDRGVYPQLRVELRASGPLGVFARSRVVTVELDHPVHVAPRPVDARVPPALRTGEAESVAPVDPRGPAGDAVRHVRPYVAGDPARLVHWPSTARTGSLVVRELEPPVRPGLAVVLDLRVDSGDADAAHGAVEHAAGRAAGLVAHALALGVPVLLATCEASGPRVAPVASGRDAGRRLARAVPGIPAPVPEGWPVVDVVAG